MEKTTALRPKWQRLRDWLVSGNTLGERVVRAGFWVFALRMAARLVGMIQTVILARLLAPEDFGLFGVAMLALATLEAFSQTGFSAALIQKKEDTGPYLDAAWTVQVVRGIILASILYAIAPAAATFFREPAARELIRALGIPIAINGLINIGVVYFQKELEFHKEFLYQFSGTLLSLPVAIIAAFVLRSAWALVVMLTAQSLIRCIASYVIHPQRSRFRLDMAKIRELHQFGRWIFGTRILKFLILQGDDAFVGRLLGAASLGFYQMAYKVSQMPATEVNDIITNVTFPAFSKLQDNRERLRNAYLRSVQFTTLITLPMAGGIFVLASELTEVVLGEKWLQIVPTMQVLCALGALKTIGAFGNLFRSIGEPQITTHVSILRLGVIVLTIYPLTNYFGIAGTALSVLAGTLIATPWPLHKALDILDCAPYRFLKNIAIPWVATLSMILAVSVAKRWLDLAGIIELGSLIILGIFIYALGTYLMDRASATQIQKNLRVLLQNAS